jgi:hypothetical protein
VPQATRDLYEPDGRVFGLFRDIRGISSAKHPAGEVWVRDLGLNVATFDRFHLVRCGDKGDDALRYNLTAECRTISPAIIADPDFAKSVTLRIGGKQYAVSGDHMVVFERTRLSMNGVTLCLSR